MNLKKADAHVCMFLRDENKLEQAQYCSCISLSAGFVTLTFIV